MWVAEDAEGVREFCVDFDCWRNSTGPVDKSVKNPAKDSRGFLVRARSIGLDPISRGPQPRILPIRRRPVRSAEITYK